MPPRMKVSIRPSDESEGATAESLKSVSGMGRAAANGFGESLVKRSTRRDQAGGNDERGANGHDSPPGRQRQPPEQAEKALRQCHGGGVVDPSPGTAEAADERRAVRLAAASSSSGSRSRIAAIESEMVAPPNACLPLSISKSTQPNAQISVRRSTLLAARLFRDSCRRRCRRSSLRVLRRW